MTLLRLPRSPCATSAGSHGPLSTSARPLTPPSPAPEGWLAPVLPVITIGLLVDALVTLRTLVALGLAFGAAYLAFRTLLVVVAGRYRFPARVTVPDEEPPRTTLHPDVRRGEHDPRRRWRGDGAGRLPPGPSPVPAGARGAGPGDRRGRRAYPLPTTSRSSRYPRRFPHGKPKACDYALERATGEFVVIYDAEDHRAEAAAQGGGDLPRGRAARRPARLPAGSAGVREPVTADRTVGRGHP